MQHFNIVSSLCRQVIKDGISDAALAQLERLQLSLLKSGSEDEAKLLGRLVSRANKSKAMTPSNVELSN